MHIVNDRGGVFLEVYYIKGGIRLEGRTRVRGAKNAVLPVMAASLMCRGRCVIHNCPDLSDVRIMIRILESYGCICSLHDGELVIDSSGTENVNVAPELMNRLRSSVFLMGPVTAAFGSFDSVHPGGCAIGKRPVDMHIDAMRCLGAEAYEDDVGIRCRIIGKRLTGADIRFEGISVGATENAMMAACMADGVTHIKNAAKEPEIIQLQDFLNAAGGRVSGAGTSVITVEGVERLYPDEFTIMSDRIETGTIIAAAAATGGNVIIEAAPMEHIKSIVDVFESAGCSFKYDRHNDELEIKAPKRLSSVGRITTAPYPGFPTDMQSQLVAAMLRAEGETVIRENIFEDRFAAVSELIRTGAVINVSEDGREAVVTGVDGINGARMRAKDLRGCAALVIAGISAAGTSIIENVCYIDRGYDKLEVVLQNLGAEVYRTKEETNGERQR